jgi:hypothetical protein
LVYHPYTITGDDETYMQFLNTVDTLIGKAPKYLEVIMGTHINSNIVNSNDIHGTDFQPTLRLHSLP